MRYLGILLFVVLFSSCFKEDEAVEPFDRGGITSIEIGMGEYYDEQFFYDLNTNKIIKQNSKIEWDIALSSANDKLDIKLNSGRFMFAAKTQEKDFSKVTDTIGLEFIWDSPSGASDSFSLKDWQENTIYVIDMGYNAGPATKIGFKKIKFIKDSDQTVSFEYMDLDGSNQGIGQLSKNQDYNFTYFSLLDQKEVEIEPKKEEYDLYFGQYIFYFEKEDIPYYVNGALLNPYLVQASNIIKVPFEDIGDNELAETPLKEKADIIGYDWKRWNFQASRYEILPNRSHIVKDVEGFFYKIRFTGFYNNDGVKGYPQVELKKL